MWYVPGKILAVTSIYRITLVHGCPKCLGCLCDCVVENSLMLVGQHVECALLSACVFIVWKPAGHPAFCSSPLMRLLLNFSLKLCWNPLSLPFGKGGSLECCGGWSFPLFIFVEEWSRVTTRMLCYARLEKARGYWPLVTDYMLVTEGRIIEKTVAHDKPFSHYLSSAVQERSRLGCDLLLAKNWCTERPQTASRLRWMSRLWAQLLFAPPSENNEQKEQVLIIVLDLQPWLFFYCFILLLEMKIILSWIWLSLSFKLQLYIVNRTSFSSSRSKYWP